MTEYLPNKNLGTKTVLDKLSDDYVAGRITEEEYGEQIRAEIDRKEKIFLSPRPLVRS